MLENEIQKEVERLGLSAGQSPRPKKKKVSGLVEDYKEGIGRRIIDALFANDLKTVAKSLVYEVAIPKTKDIMADLFIGGIEKAIYGDESRGYSGYSSRSSGPSRKASYDAYYQGGKYYSSEPVSVGQKPKVRWDRLIFQTRPEACELLSNLRLDIRKYGYVTVTDVYDYVTEIDEELGTLIDSEFPDSNWGWKNLDRVPIESVARGFWVKLPKPERIEN